MNLTNQAKGYLMVGGAGFFWGTGFLFIQYILDSGMTSADMISWKMLIGFIIMFTYTYFKDKELLKIDKKGILSVSVIAIVCHVLYNFFMNSSVELASIATAVSLLYTAPIFVLIISRIIFKEPFTFNKIVATFVCLVGVFLTVTGGAVDALSFNVLGVVYGLASGLCYGLMNIFNKVLLSDYKQATILTYTFGLAFIFSLTISNPLTAFQLDTDIWFWINILLYGFVPTVLGYFSFITGLAQGIESSKASIIATIEVPISVVGSYLIFGDDIFGWMSVGIVLVILSVILLRVDELKNSSANKLKST